MTFLAYLFVAIAAIFNAAMDRLENAPAFNKSIFNHLDKRFWLKELSWQYAKKIFGYKLDAWHLCKSAVVCLLVALVFFRVDWWHYFLLGATWNIVFVFFYKKVMYRK